MHLKTFEHLAAVQDYAEHHGLAYLWKSTAAFENRATHSRARAIRTFTCLGPLPAAQPVEISVFIVPQPVAGLTAERIVCNQQSCSFRCKRARSLSVNPRKMYQAYPATMNPSATKLAKKTARNFHMWGELAATPRGRHSIGNRKCAGVSIHPRTFKWVKTMDLLASWSVCKLR